MATNLSQPPFSFDGLIYNAETQKGIPNLVVSFYNLKPEFIPPPDISAEKLIERSVRIGSTRNNEDGKFIFRYAPFQTADTPVATLARPVHVEMQINLVIVVSAPDTAGDNSGSRIIYFSNPPRYRAGATEFFSIAVPNELAVKYGLANDLAEAAIDTHVRKRVESYMRGKNENKKFTEGVAGFHKEIVLREAEEKKSFAARVRKDLATNADLVSFTGVMVKDDVDIPMGVTTVAEASVDTANTVINDNSNGVPVNLFLTEEDRLRIFGTTTSGEVEVKESEIKKILLRSSNTNNAGTLLIQNNPIVNYCREHSFEEKCAKEHTGLTVAAHATTPASPTVNASLNGTDETLNNQKIPDYISRLIDDMPSPDSVLDPSISNKRPNRTMVEDNVDQFSLKKGPADTAAFYDFHTLQIAFDFVWKQLFDEELVNLAYKANTIYKGKFGTDITVLGGGKFPIKVDWIGQLQLPIPPVVLQYFAIGNEEWQELSPELQSKLKEIAESIHAWQYPVIDQYAMKAEKYIQRLTDQGEHIIESVRHDDYYTLHKTLRDLHTRINSKYEFTVFAADKDHHSVNFGILNTYRQRWEPLSYQPGKLVKTIALTPKEERKYSVKITQSVKQSRKEAIKNNSTISREQSNTSKVETDIIRKAHTKTNFEHSGQFDVDFAAYKGTAKTTFGTQADSESSSSRKDFREAVLKATQEYKEERAVEVNTEENYSSEYNESGTIVNPNDELAVTYLFYELQRRYRLSEQLYRIMPVVLVAQEVPSPDQITEAWVIAHDWIINRYLLDDSFRPCLDYLAKKSVGDDFAIRELRKNLREQRSLVNTLKIEVAQSSKEADNRYYALERAILSRIEAEKSENQSGFFIDAVESLFVSATDPESAKARELAAKDAHQYAVEKAEKLASTLQGEVNNLHKLTTEYNHTLRSHLDNESQIKRLLVHLRNNILYYMQGIWSLEPPDQRYLRLHKVEVPVPEVDGERTCTISFKTEPDIFASFRADGTTKHKGYLKGRLKKPVQLRPLAQIADLDSFLGFKGNLMIFPLKQHNAVTEFMAAPYIDTAFGAMDPDQLSNISLEDYSKYVCCLHDNLKEEDFNELKEGLMGWLSQLMSDPLRNNDEIVVPTNSVFVEALPAANSLLEDFKLRHREADVRMAVANLRIKELEALRLATRLLNAKLEDPDIEKKIVVEGSTHLDVNEN